MKGKGGISVFLYILKKEFRCFFSSKGTLIVMFALPLLLLLIFGFALGDYVRAEYGTFHGGTMYYLMETENPERVEDFQQITEQITLATTVVFVEVYDEIMSQSQIEESLAYGLITVKEIGYSYFRSPFNEPQGGEMVRNLFVQLANQEEVALSHTSSERVILDMPQMDSLGYYAFSSLAFSILFMGLLVGFSVQNEKVYGTLERIQLSKGGIPTVFLTKLLAGLICGMGQILTVFLFSTLVLQVDWGNYTGIIFLLFAFLSLYSSVFGGVMGVISKSKAGCQNTVLTLSMLSGYFGGAITPLYLLENTAFMNIMIHCSPLYWFNKASISLQQGIYDESVAYAFLVLGGLILVWLCVLSRSYGKKSTKNRSKGRVAS